MLPRSGRVGTIYTSAAEVRDRSRSRAAHGAFYATISLPGAVYNTRGGGGVLYNPFPGYCAKEYSCTSQPTNVKKYKSWDPLALSRDPSWDRGCVLMIWTKKEKYQTDNILMAQYFPKRYKKVES